MSKDGPAPPPAIIKKGYQPSVVNPKTGGYQGGYQAPTSTGNPGKPPSGGSSGTKK